MKLSFLIVNRRMNALEFSGIFIFIATQNIFFFLQFRYQGIVCFLFFLTALAAIPIDASKTPPSAIFAPDDAAEHSSTGQRHSLWNNAEAKC